MVMVYVVMGVRGRLDERMMAWDETIAEDTNEPKDNHLESP